MFLKMDRIDILSNYFIALQYRLLGTIFVLGKKNKVAKGTYYALLFLEVILCYRFIDYIAIFSEKAMYEYTFCLIFILFVVVLFRKAFFFVFSIFAFPLIFALEQLLYKEINDFVEIPRFNCRSRPLSIHQNFYVQKLQEKERMKDLVSEGFENGIAILLNSGYRSFKFKTNKLIIMLMLQKIGLNRLEIKRLMDGGVVKDFKVERFGLISIELEKLKQKSYVPEKALLSEKPNFRRKYPKYKVLLHFS